MMRHLWSNRFTSPVVCVERETGIGLTNPLTECISVTKLSFDCLKLVAWVLYSFLFMNMKHVIEFFLYHIYAPLVHIALLRLHNMPSDYQAWRGNSFSCEAYTISLLKQHLFLASKWRWSPVVVNSTDILIAIPAFCWYSLATVSNLVTELLASFLAGASSVLRNMKRKMYYAPFLTAAMISTWPV
jgi:hypothetical protein